MGRNRACWDRRRCAGRFPRASSLVESLRRGEGIPLFLPPVYTMGTMSFDPQAIFANLTEQEKIKGHHSPEGRAIRTLSRALNSWSTNNLSARDVLVLCDQAVEDWLKARLRISA